VHLTNNRRISRWLSTFIAAWFSMRLLQSKESEAFIDRVPPNTYSPSGLAIKSRKFAGRTMDLTLFSLTRAVDVIVGELWSRRRTKRMAANKWTGVETTISKLTDPGIFATSCGLIMWAWIYLPERLPRAYVKWISGAAAVDKRLVKALQYCQWGEIKYGQETGQAPLLQSMCEDYGWPLVWGDPAKSVPFPCEIVHMGTGPNCEYHAARRFLKGFCMAAGMYGPINLALQLRNPSKRGFQIALISAVRSSAFLGSFIALFYYSICLARSRIGPLVFGTSAQACQRIDSGICVACGCMSCGWSILIENAGRRKDMSLFVAPRALATLLPRRYQMAYQWRETAAFAASAAVVFTCARENPERVRGVLGKILAGVLKQ
jgi:hypothetical protein